MGRRGPPPKPTKLKIAAGNPGKRPLNKAEPQPQVGEPGMPSWMSRKAKEEWRRIVPELMQLGLLTLVDLAALAAYCQSYSELEAATRRIDKEGRIVAEPVMSSAGVKVGVKYKAHPAVRLQRDALRCVKQFISEFGLTPASRTRVHGADKDPQDSHEARFFGSA